MKFALFGGTFDPVHRAHLALADAARRELALDRVYFVPARLSPLKKDGSAAPARHRLAMLRAALRGRPCFRVSDWELRQRGVSYTHRTLSAFRRRHPSARLHLLVGGDALKTWTRWRNWRRLLTEARVVVGRRRGLSFSGVPATVRRRVTVLRQRLPKVSSTEIRARLRAGRSVAAVLPPAVARYIRRHGLYGSGRG